MGIKRASWSGIGTTLLAKNCFPATWILMGSGKVRSQEYLICTFISEGKPRMLKLGAQPIQRQVMCGKIEIVTFCGRIARGRRCLLGDFGQLPPCMKWLIPIKFRKIYYTIHTDTNQRISLLYWRVIFLTNFTR